MSFLIERRVGKEPIGTATLSYGSWIYNYLFNQCLSPLKLWVRTRSWRDHSIQHY